MLFRSFAHQCLEPQHLRPLIKVDAQAQFAQLTDELYQQIDSLQPWGIGNDFPIFWTANVRVLEQKVVGKSHLKLTLLEAEGKEETRQAIAWRWGSYFPLPNRLDIAYKLKENRWNGQSRIELEIVGVRLPVTTVSKGTFVYRDRIYTCSYGESLQELRIRNEKGQVLAIKKGETTGLLGTSRETAQKVDISQPFFVQLIAAAQSILGVELL